MHDQSKQCACGRIFTESDSTGVWCFRCKLNGLSFNFVGGGSYGREAFHNKTNFEVTSQTERHAKRIGIKAEKISTRAVLV